jgi:phenylacetate-CoA ligase
MTTARTATRVADMVAALRRSKELDSHDGWSVARLREHQETRLADLVRHAVAHSPLYRELYAGIDTAEVVDIERLPSIDKTLLMERFDDVVTDPRLRLANLEAHLDHLTSDELYLGQYRVVSTGGSTGHRGIFVAGRAEWREYLAGLLRVNAYMGLWPRIPRRRRIATVAASRALHVTYRMSRSLDIGLHRVLRLDASSPVEQLVEPLNRYRPEFLYSYPSVLSLLAVEQLEGRLEIAPTTIVSSGETHTADLVSTVRAAWDVPWFQIYGTTEVPTLGAHCSYHSGLHLFEDMAIVEVVDEDDQPVPPGQTGHRMLVTNLVNRTQPLIRYAISDMVAVAPHSCPCGRPFLVLEAVEGRNDDILHLPAEGGGDIAVHPLALRSPMAATTGVKQYRMIYDHNGLIVRVVLRAGVAADTTKAAITRGIREKLASLDATPVNVDVTVVERIDDGRDSAGKFKVIESRTEATRPRGQTQKTGR